MDLRATVADRPTLDCYPDLPRYLALAIALLSGCTHSNPYVAPDSGPQARLRVVTGLENIVILEGTYPQCIPSGAVHGGDSMGVRS